MDDLANLDILPRHVEAMKGIVHEGLSWTIAQACPLFEILKLSKSPSPSAQFGVTHVVVELPGM
jgi:hypothetical protein